jgi:hypothetical protein
MKNTRNEKYEKMMNLFYLDTIQSLQLGVLASRGSGHQADTLASHAVLLLLLEHVEAWEATLLSTTGTNNKTTPETP